MELNTDPTELFRDKRILITGGLGSIGSEIARQLLHYNPKYITVMDNRETEMFYAKTSTQADNRIQYLFGDIRDKETVLKAMDAIDVVFHAAAMKHVVICEHDPMEAVKTNVIGTQNIIEAALHYNIERIIMISTDKAINPTNVMGATKLLAERLFSASSHKKGGKQTKFGIVRFGNVLASRGSVLEIWDNQLKAGKKISITDPKMTRFFMSIPESVKLIFNASQYANNGETFILKMPSIRICDLAKVFLNLRKMPSANWEIVGIRPGEKLHEELIFEEESSLILQNENMLVRLPLLTETNNSGNYLQSSGFSKANVKSFSSDNESSLLSENQIREVLLQSLRL